MSTTLLQGLVAMLWMAYAVTLCAAGGYQAIGCLTYTGLDDSGSPRTKQIMMFHVKVGSANWKIRTEPVIEAQNGIGFYEASSISNDCVLSVIAFASAYKSSESPFQRLRAELKQSKADDVYFVNTSWSPFVSNAVSSKVSSERNSNHLNNVAVAVTRKGRIPPMNPSFIALVWFAFTPPVEQADGVNKMLFQIWDDGNPMTTRFRRAEWNQFAKPPYLVSNAQYTWLGRETFPDGAVKDIPVFDIRNPLGTAAIYNVDATTNFSGFMVPLNFRLTRFLTNPSEKGKTNVSSTIVASVVKVSLLSSDESLEVKVPGKTFVSDFARSAPGLKASPLTYILDSNSRIRLIPPAAPPADHNWTIRLGHYLYGISGHDPTTMQGVQISRETLLHFGTRTFSLFVPFYVFTGVVLGLLSVAVIVAAIAWKRQK